MPIGTSASKSPELLSVSCPAPGDCVAVGVYAATSGAILPMIVFETSGTWGAVQTPALPATATTGTAELGELTNVDCPSLGNCVAIGLYENADKQVHALAETQVASGAFTPVELPDEVGGPAKTFGAPLGVSCTTPADCSAIGFDFDARSRLTAAAWSESAGVWSAPTPMPSTIGILLMFPTSIACPDATTCIATGEAIDRRGHVRPQYSIEANGVWAPAQMLALPTLSPKAFDGRLTSISCDTTAVCEAVGEWIGASRHGVVAGAVTWSSGSWSSAGYVRGVPGSARIGAAFNSVSCPSTSQCVAIGTTGASSIGLLPEGHLLSESALRRVALQPFVDARTTKVLAFSAVLAPVRPISTPRGPSGVHGTGLTGALVARWYAPVDDGGSPVVSFTAVADPGAHSCTTVGNACVIRGLTNGRQYRLLVTDRTIHAQSIRVYEPGFVLVGHVPGAPSHLHVSPGANFVDVSWRAARTPRGEAVERYVVELHGNGGVLRHCETRRTACRIARLPVATAYYVSVVAVDANGDSAPSITPTRTV